MARKRRKSPKQKAFEWLSRYKRLKAAVEYTKLVPSADNEYAPCVTCGAIKHIKRADGGHFIGRGIGGGSGVYLNQDNVHFQCKYCNGFRSQTIIAPAYRKYMIETYSLKLVEHLEREDRIRIYNPIEVAGLHEYYKSMYEQLCEEIGRSKKW